MYNWHLEINLGSENHFVSVTSLRTFNWKTAPQMWWLNMTIRNFWRSRQKQKKSLWLRAHLCIVKCNAKRLDITLNLFTMQNWSRWTLSFIRIKMDKYGYFMLKTFGFVRCMIGQKIPNKFSVNLFLRKWNKLNSKSKWTSKFNLMTNLIGSQKLDII